MVEDNENIRKKPAGPRRGGPMGMGQSNFEKPKNFKKSFKKLISVLKPFAVPTLIAIIIAIISAILTLVGPSQIRTLTNEIGKGIIPGGSVDLVAVTNIGIALAFIYALSSILSLTQGIIMTTVTQKISKNLRRRISTKINRLPLKYLDAHSHGDILSRVTNDVDTIGQSLNNSVATLISALTLFIGSIIMMFATNWIMAISAIGASLIGVTLMAVIMKKSQKYFKAQQENLGNINGHIEEIYAGHNVVKAYNAEKQNKKEFDKINTKLYESGWKSKFFSGLIMPLMSFIGNFGYVVVYIVGALLVVNGNIDFGVITAFLIYVRLFSQPLSQIAQVGASLQSSAAASERVFEFLNEDEMIDEQAKHLEMKKIKGNVEFKNVHFGYNPDKTIINDFSVKIKHGQKVAIVGPTGAGKTTMVNLLMRFYETNSGNIIVDGVNTNELTRSQVHDMFSMVLQDTWTFNGTIKENIIYSKQDVTDEQVEEACKVCGLHHFVNTLSKGYDTMLNDNTSISAGQKQLLTIARAMIQNSPMLILDEATSSVDTRTEILIQEAMDKLTKNRTSFVIAHRLSTIKNADLILVMKDGDIIEQGSHNDLIAKNGFYADLYNSQFEEE